MLLFRAEGVGARVTSGDAEFGKLAAENLATIASYGENLMQVVCRDVCDGHDVGKVRNKNLCVSLLGLM